MDEEVATNTNIDVTWTKAHEAIRDYCTEEIKSDDRDSSGTVSSPRHQILKYNVICERLRNGEKKVNFNSPTYNVMLTCWRSHVTQEAPLHFTREEKVFFGSQYPRLKRHFDKETLTVLCRKLSTDLAIWAEQTHRQDLVYDRTADKINSVLKGQLRDRGVKGWLYRKYVKHCEGSRYLGASDYDIRLEDAPPKAGIKRGRYHSASDASEDAELPKPKRVGMIPLFNSDEDEDTD